MIRRRHLVLAFIAGAAVPVLLLYLFLRAAPYFIREDEAANVLSTALAEPIRELREAGRQVIYVRSDFDTALLQKLRVEYPSLKLLPWAERPEDLGCKPTDPDATPVGPCLRNDFVAA